MLPQTNGSQQKDLLIKAVLKEAVALKLQPFSNSKFLTQTSRPSYKPAYIDEIFLQMRVNSHNHQLDESLLTLRYLRKISLNTLSLC